MCEYLLDHKQINIDSQDKWGMTVCLHSSFIIFPFTHLSFNPFLLPPFTAQYLIAPYHFYPVYVCPSSHLSFTTVLFNFQSQSIVHLVKGRKTWLYGLLVKELI